MTFWFVCLLFVFGTLKIVVSSMPTSMVNAIIRKFELHPTLHIKDVTITKNGEVVEEEEKENILTEFNEGIFLERHYFPPSSSGTPLIIEMNDTKKKMSFAVYSYDEYVDVFKTYKKKVIAYRMRSKYLQSHFSS